MVKFGGSRRTSQPQQAARINRRNHLGAAVQHYQTGIDTRGWASVNGHSKTVGAVGICTSFASASLQYLKANTKVTGYPFTFAAVVKRRTTGVDQSILSIGAATNDRHLLYFAATDTVAAFSGAGATFDQAISTTTFVDTNKYYVVVAVYASATDRKVYVDGVLQAASTGAVSPAAADTATLGAYWTNGAPVANFYFNGDIPVSLISDKAWSVEQVTDWTKNQWQIFQPRKRQIYVNVAASGAQNLTPALYPDADTFFAATVTPGSVALTPGLYADADTFYAATVALNGEQSLTPSLFTDADTFHAAIVTPGAVSLTPNLYADADTFYAATVAAGYNLQPAAFSDSDTFYAATVALGAPNLAPALFVDGDTFYSPSVSGGSQPITPALYANSSEFYAAKLADGSWQQVATATGTWTDKPLSGGTWTTL